MVVVVISGSLPETRPVLRAYLDLLAGVHLGDKVLRTFLTEAMLSGKTDACGRNAIVAVSLAKE